MKLKRLGSSLLLGLVLTACNTQSGRLAQLETTPDKNPEDLYIKLGVQYIQLGNFNIALKNLKKALAINPRSSDAHDTIGILYQQLKRPSQARTHFQQAVSLRSGNARAHNNYGRFLCAQGEIRVAQQQFKQAYENPLYSNQIVALTNAGSCALDNNDLEQAEQHLRRALKQNPTFSPALIEMATLRSKQGKHLLARAFLQRFQETQAKPTAKILWLGVQTELALGDKRAALQYKKILFEQFPQSKQAMLARQAISGF